MKKINARLIVFSTDTQKLLSEQYNDVQTKVPLYPKTVYTQPSEKRKDSLKEYTIQHLVSLNISDSYENLTQTATVELPLKGTILYRDNNINGSFTRGFLYFVEEDVKLYEGQQVMLDVGYNEHYQTRFIGFVNKFVEQESTILITLEDSMYKLKNTVSFKKNFPKLYGKDKHTFNLNDFNQWIVQKLFDINKDKGNIFVPRIKCYSTDLGKIVMLDDITPAEMYKYFFKDVYNMKVFFRLEYVDTIRDKKSFNHLMEPVLYVGWSNWHLLEYNEIDIINKKAIIGLNRHFTDKDISYTSRKYSNTFKFQYPYIEGDVYNPIVENNLEWYNTDKDNIRITATSFSAADHKKITVIYQYGIFSNSKDSADEKEKRKKANTGNSAVIKDSNNLQTFNEVTLYYPNLDETGLKNKVIEYYNQYPTSGLRGSITVLGEPYVRQGDIVQLKIDTSHIRGEQNYITDDNQADFTKYYIKSVNTTMDSQSGLRQELVLDRMVGESVDLLSNPLQPIIKQK